MFRRYATALGGAIIGFAYAEKRHQEARVNKNLSKLRRTFESDYTWLYKFGDATNWSGWDSLTVGAELADGMNNGDDLRNVKVRAIRKQFIELLKSVDVFWYHPIWNVISAERKEINDLCFEYAFALMVVEAYYWNDRHTEISHKIPKLIDLYKKSRENEYQCRALEKFFKTRQYHVPYEFKYIFERIMWND